jgi:hypothetical protein
MAKFFNTAGPQQPDINYTLPPLARWNLSEILSLIDQRRYFILHAPRQTGKTTCLLTLAEHLNREGRYRALYTNIETAQTAREDVGRGIAAITQAIASAAEAKLQDTDAPALARQCLGEQAPDEALRQFLTRWCRASSRPTVLMLDEVDALVGDTLVSLLRQLRAGYADRPAQFPQSLILCGVRDLQDYRIQSTQAKAIITGGSAFNIKTKSLRLGNFSRDQMAALYCQHTDETGQEFSDDALAEAWELTGGQPWLVNALAHEATWEMEQYRDRTLRITSEVLATAAERLIASRATHLDQLTDKLQEPRVRRVIEPILAGGDEIERIPTDDVQYVQDLGLISTSKPLRIANKIYREVIPRELIWSTEFKIAHDPAWYVRGDGGLDMSKLLAAFQDFFRQHSEHWIERFDYKEAGPQLLLQAFLQRIVNTGGRIEREYGLGRKRTDLLIVWPHPAGVQRVVIEVKLVRGLGQAQVAEAVAQTSQYMDKCGTGEGHLILFDRRAGRSWAKKIYQRAKRDAQGRTIKIWGA